LEVAVAEETSERKAMAEIAEKYCEKVILTDEDPYDDNPKKLSTIWQNHFVNKKPEIILTEERQSERRLNLQKRVML
jgi:UDP-N-acetylmuramyl tripeptide synthase